jgi:ketosteroid isomerase-like protein
MIDTMSLWHEIAKSRQPERLNEILADDAVMVSPVVFTPQRGKAITQKYLAAAMHVFFNPKFKYVREFKGDHSCVLEFETEVDGKYINGVDMISWNEQGLITEFRVMLRPLQAVTTIHEMMGAKLEML